MSLSHAERPQVEQAESLTNIGNRTAEVRDGVGGAVKLTNPKTIASPEERVDQQRGSTLLCDAACLPSAPMVVRLTLRRMRAGAMARTR